MPLRDFKEMIIKPNREVIINKTIDINHKKYHLMSLIDGTLWLCYESKLQEMFHDPTNDSNRDMLSRSHNHEMLTIKELMIQGQTFTVKSSSATHCNYHNIESIMHIQHFGEKGCIPDFIYDLELDQITIARYTQVADEKALKIDLSKPLDMTIELQPVYETIMINKTFTLNFDKEAFEYNHMLKNGESISCMIDGLEMYDLWATIDDKYKDIPYSQFTQDQINEMKKQYKMGMEKLCPKDQKLAIINYRSPKGLSFNFFDKAYLDQAVELNGHGYAFLIKSDKENIGELINNVCQIKAVNHEETIEVELLSATITHPSQLIKIKEL